MTLILAPVLALALGAASTGAPKAAELTYLPPERYDLERFPIPNPHGEVLPRHQIRLTGAIGKSDVVAFDRIVAEHRLDDRPEYPAVLVLDSPGGSFKSGIELAGRVRAVNMATLLPKEAQCLSACAVVFMAGYEYLDESGATRPRYVEVPGKLGFHRPFFARAKSSLSLKTLQSLPPEQMQPLLEQLFTTFDRQAQASYDAANELIKDMLEVDPQAWSNDLLLAMLLATSDVNDRFVYLTTVAQSIDWGISTLNVQPRRIDGPASEYEAAYWLCMNTRSPADLQAMNWFLPQTPEDAASAVRTRLEELANGGPFGNQDWPPIEAAQPELAYHDVVYESLYGSGCRVGLATSPDVWSTVTLIDGRDVVNEKYLPLAEPRFHAYTYAPPTPLAEIKAE